MDLWPVESSISLFEAKSGRKISFQLSTTNEIPSSYPSDVAWIYQSDPLLQKLNAHSRVLYLLSQNRAGITIQGDCTGLTSPLFLSSRPTVPSCKIVQMRFFSATLNELPEVREFDHRMAAWAVHGDKWDRALVDTSGRTTVGIPENWLLPATLVGANAESAIVYSVVRWRDDSVAEVRVYNSDGCVSVESGSHVVRRLRDPVGVLWQTHVGVIE